MVRRQEFVSKLAELLDDNSNNHIIRWSENGEALTIVNMPKFIEETLPKYFNHNNISSFVR